MKKGKKICGTNYEIAVYVFIVLLVTVVPYFFHNGYTEIVTYKYSAFFWICIGFFAVAAPMFLISRWREKDSRPSITDWFVAAFLGLNIITFSAAEFKAMALIGYPGWCMGFVTMLFFCGIYFFVSRGYDAGKKDLMPFMLVCAVLIFIWGMMDRFSVPLVEMYGANAGYLGPIGNINWFAGYWSVFFPAGAVMYCYVKKRAERVLLGVYTGIAIGCGVVNASDSTFLSMGLVLLLLWFFAFRTIGMMKRFAEIVLIGAGTCQLLRLIDIAAPDAMSLRSGLIDLALSNVTLVLLIGAIAFRFLLQRNSDDNEELLPKYRLLEVLLPIAVVIVILIVLIAQGFFAFDESWGSGRGRIWAVSWEAFTSLPALRMLFGVGQDSFAACLYQIPEIAKRLTEVYPEATLTNAHSEALNFLINIGIFGTVAFYGISVSAVVRGMKKSGERPYLYAISACIFSYLVHNTVSFSTIVNTPFLFLMLGLLEAELRKE